MRVLIDGVPIEDDQATIPVFDWAVQRGFGCFELVRSYGGIPFRVKGHVARLGSSLEIMHLPAPDLDDVEDWIRAMAAEGGDCYIRCLVTAGSRDPMFPSESRTIVIREQAPDVPDHFRLLPLPAPWVAAGESSELTGAKTLSYAPNMAAMLAAQREGYDDALLLSRDGWVLEGPTFSAAWVIGGAMEVPSLDLGLLASITRVAAIEVADRLGIEVREGRYPLDRMLAADEVLALSTVKEVTSVVKVGDAEFAPGPVTAKLAAAFADLVRTELAAERPSPS